MLAAIGLIHWPVQGAMLTRGYQQGLAQPAVGLGQALASADPVTVALAQRMERADVIRRFDPERLRATPPFMLASDGRFLPSVSDIHPRADMQVRWLGDENGELSVQPWGAQGWKVSLRSKGKVRPDWSAYSGLVAYYDLERIWIADIQGKRFQSVAQMPALDEGGVLRFSADGTALGAFLDQESRWVAQDLYVLLEGPR